MKSSRYLLTLFAALLTVSSVPSLVIAQSATFKNPLVFTSVTSLLAAILNVIVVISIPFVVFFLIYAGFLYVTARGKPEQIQQAGRALLYGIIGGVIIVGSTAILAIMQNVVTSFTP